MERVPLKGVIAVAAVLAIALASPGAARAADPSPKPPPARATPAAGGAPKPATPAAPAKGVAPSKPAAAGKSAVKSVSKDGKDAAGKDGADKPSPRNGSKTTRANSVLKSDKLLPGRADLRSESERKRDAELRSHFSRVAELDAIAAVASEKGDVSLQEYVDLVRRKELQRHQKVMMALSRADAQANALAIAGGQP
jgi:hypothetical protein